MQLFLGLLILFFSFNSYSTDFYSNNKKGFWITPKTASSNKILKVGDEYTFEGDICIVKWGGTAIGNGKSNCLKVGNSSKVIFKAYFPDSLNDVSDKLIVTQSKDKKSWSYKFKTEKLKATDLNQFTITIGTDEEKTTDLLAVKAKLEKRILILNDIKANYVGRSGYGFNDNLAYLNKTINYLNGLIGKINIALDSVPENLAQLRYPLQLENNLAAPLFYSSNFSGHKIGMKLPIGVAFEGEKATIEASITNLSNKSFYFPEILDDDLSIGVLKFDGKQKYKISIQNDGSNLVSTLPFSLGFGETKTLTVQSKALKITDINKVKTLVESSSSSVFDTLNWFNRTLGTLSYDLFVIEDRVAPVFSNLKPDADSFLKENPKFEATLKDSVGRINPQSLTVMLNGQNVTSSFTSKTEDSGVSYVFSGVIPNLAEGSYEIIYTCKDFAGNTKSTSLKTIHYDKTSPIINLANSDHYLAGNANYDVNLSISDTSPVTTKIIQNGEVVYTSQNKSINYVATLVRGMNTFEFQSTDAAGNVSNTVELKDIVLDFTPPVISITNLDNQILDNPSYPIAVSITDQSGVKSKILKNGIEVYSSTEKAFTYTAILVGGLNTFEIQSVDSAGNNATPIKLNSITFDNIPPVIAVDQSSNFLTNNPLFMLSGSISDNSNIEYSIYLNGNFVSKSSLKNISKIVNLEEGSNTIIISAMDVAGNKSNDFVLSNIKLDTKPPELAINLPFNNALLKGENIDAKATSNEDLKQANINGNQVGLSTDKRQFEIKLNLSKDGVSLISYSATDLAGNTSEVTRSISIDNTAPEIEILSRHGFDTTDKNYHLNLVVKETNDVQVQVIFNGQLLAEGDFKSFEKNLVLNQGKNTFFIKAIDEVGNSLEYSSREIVVDSISPTIASTSKQNILTNNKSYNLSATFEDSSDLKYEIYQNGKQVASKYEKSINEFFQLTEGINEFVIKATDLAGNKAADVELKNIVLDITNPALKLDTEDNVLTSNDIFNIRATATDIHLGESVILQNNVEIYRGPSSDVNFNATLKEGKNTFSIKTKDLATNSSEELVLNSIVLNNSTPIISSSNKENIIVTNSKHLINLKISDDLDTTTIVKQNGTEVYRSADKTISIYANLLGGANNFEIISTDIAGNISIPFTLKNIYLDNVAPEIKSTISDNQLTNKKDFTLLASIDDVSNVDSKIYQNGELIYSGNLKIFNIPVVLREGVNSFEIRSSDNAGNAGVPFKINKITLDSVKPVIVASSARDILTKNPIAFVNASAFDLSTITFKLLHNDQQVFSANSTFLEYSFMLSEGINKLEFIAIDAAGNLSDPYILNNIILDTSGPTINLANVNESVQATNSFTINGTIQDFSRFNYQIYENNALVHEGSTENINYIASLASGKNSFKIVAIDELGNSSFKTIENIYLDDVSPFIEIASSELLTKNKNYNLSVKVQDASSVTTKIYQNNVLVENSNLKEILKGIVLSDGINEFRISATDSYGNISSDKLFTVVLDMNSPTVQFYPGSGHVFNLTNVPEQGLIISFHDQSKINLNRLRVKLNGELVEQSLYSVDLQSNQVTLSLSNEKLPLLINQNNTFSIEIGDELENVSISSTSYLIKEDENFESDKPIINFKPGGGVVRAPLASIEIGFASKIGINYQSLNVLVNGISLPLNLISIDEQKSRAILNLSGITQSENDIGLTIEARVSDQSNNLSHSKIGINYLKDLNSNLIAEVITESAFGGNGNHICVPLSTGEAKCWGQNISGALGRASLNGYDGNLSLIPNINLGEKITKIKTGGNRTCAIVESGKMYCWGYNEDGSLGYGNKTLYDGTIPPRNLGALNIGAKVVDLVMTSTSTCILIENGNVKCWGGNSQGLLGYGATFQWSFDKTPIDIPNVNLGGVAKQISGFNMHMCALMENGDVKCWGYNAYGQLGYGHKNNIGDDEEPILSGAVPLGEKAVQLSLGNNHTCAILESGSLRCWGRGIDGQLGLGSNGDIGDTVSKSILSVAPITLDSVPIQVAAGNVHTCALFENKKIKCWGNNYSGQLGLARSVSSNEKPIDLPYVDVGGEVKVVQVMSNRTCVTMADNSFKCWGDNDFNYPLLGYNHVYKLGDDESIITQLPVAIGSPITDFTVGLYQTCVVLASGKVKCWGENINKNLSSSTNKYIGADGKISQLALINPNFDIYQLASKSYTGHFCAVTSGQNVRCWGTGYSGSLGVNQSYVAIDNAQDLLPSSDKAIQVATGENFSCVLLNTGTVKCWGANSKGQLGRGNTSSDANAVAVSIGEQVLQISAGYDYVCAITVSNKVRCWGNNNTGQLGLGNTQLIGDNELPSSVAAVNLGTGRTAKHISSGYYTNCATLDNGNIRCWGANNFNQLGYSHKNTIGDNEQPSSQAELYLDSPVIQTSIGIRHSCALLNTKRVKCWGHGNDGKLGYGSINHIPGISGLATLPIVENIIKIGSGDDHNCAMLENGNLRCWGSNTSSQLGYLNLRTVGDDETPASFASLNLGATVLSIDPDEYTQSLRVLANYAPSIYYGQGPLDVTFNGLTSYSLFGDIVSYQWDFNDGSPIQISSSPLVTHSFTSQGVYTVKLTVTDSVGNKGEYSQYITVLGQNILPIAKLSSNKNIGPAPLNISFDASASQDPAGFIINYEYNFGDGTVINSNSTNIDHTYLNPGHYSAKVIVTDNNGGKVTSEAKLITIPVDPSAPVITSPTMGQFRTAEASFNIKAVIQDNENVTVSLLHNNEIIFTDSSKTLNKEVILKEGNNYFEIQAVDELNNRAIPLSIGYIVLDTDLPKIATTTKSDSFTNQKPYPLNVKVNDSTRTTTKIILNGELVTTSLGEDFVVALDLVSGSNKVEIVATDEFGSTSSTIIENLTLDQQLPVLSEVKPVANSILTKRKIQFFAKSDDILTSASLNGVALTLSEDKKTISGEVEASMDGDFNINVKAIDRAKNEAMLSFKVAVDTFAPILSYTPSTGYYGNNSKYNISLNISDISGTTTEIYQNGKLVYTTTDSNISYDATLDEGGNSFVITSKDQNGNEVNPGFIGNVNLDTTGPVIVSNTISNQYTNKSNFPLSFNILEPLNVTTKIYVNDVEKLTTTSKFVNESISLSSGNNKIVIKSIDEAGNAGSNVEINNIYLDQILPVVAIENKKDKYSTDNRNLNISGNIQDETPTITKFILNGNTQNTTNLKNFSQSFDLSEGTNNIEVIAEDSAGNIGNASLHEIVLDTLPPVILSSSSEVKNVFETNFLVDLKIEDISSVSTDIYLNGNAIYNSREKEFYYSVKLRPGQNTISVVSTDSFGHQSVHKEIARLNYDTAAPVIKLSSNGDIFTNQTSYNLKASIEDGAEVKSFVRLNDNLVFTTSDKTIDTSINLREGNNTLSIQAVEEGSGKNSVKFIDHVVLDTSPPVITTSGQQNFITNERLFKLPVSIIDTNGAEATIYLNGKQVFKSAIKDFVAPIFLQSGTNTILIQSKDIADNVAVPVTLSGINYQSSSNIATTIGVGGGKYSVTNSSSIIYGAYVEVGSGAVNEVVNLSVASSSIQDLPEIVNVPTPDPIGPVVKYSVNKRVSTESTFNNEVVVGVPFSPTLANSKKVNSANFSIIRYDSTKNIVERIEPFKIDLSKGIAYGYTKSFSHFFVADGNSYPRMALDQSSNCNKSEQGYSCDFTESQYELKGIFRSSNLNTANDLSVTCTNCESTKELVNEVNEKLVRFTISGTSENSGIQNLTFRSGNLVTNKKIVMKNISIPLAFAEGKNLMNNCFEPGAICKVGGVESQTVDSSIKFALSRLVGPHHLKLKNSITKHDGVLYWIEEANIFPTYKVHELVNYRIFEFALKRLNLDGSISTINNLKVAIDSRKIVQNDWEYNFNIQVESNLILLSLDSSNHLFAEEIDKIFVNDYAKILVLNSETREVSYLNKSEDIRFTDIKEIKFTEDKVFVLGSSFNTVEDTDYEEGLFEYDRTNDVWSYLTTAISKPMDNSGRSMSYQGDGTHISQFDARSMSQFNVVNDDIYFLNSSFNCVRRFDSSRNLSTVAGICNDSEVYKGRKFDYANEKANKLLLGDIKSLDSDIDGNLYLSQSINGKLELSIVSSETGILKGAVKDDSKYRLPSSTEAIRVDQVTVAIDEREDSAVRLDSGENAYFYNNSCVYNIASPYEYLFKVLEQEEKDLEVALNNENLEKLILDSQNQNGYFDFDTSNFDEGKRVSDTLDALKFLARAGDQSSDTINKARLWTAGQKFNDTKNSALKLETQAILAKLIGAKNMTSELKAELEKFIKEYRVAFGGWGSTVNHIINNDDTSVAIRAITYILNQFPADETKISFYLSDFISPLRNMIGNQFGQGEASFEGGFSTTNIQNMPSLEVTLNVVDAFVEFRKINSKNDKFIYWNQKANFQTLTTVEIPNSLLSAVKYVRNFKSADGSFGSIKTTIQVLNTFNEIIKTGAIKDPATIASLSDDIIKGLAYIKAQSVDKNLALSLSRLSAVDNINSLGKKIASVSSPSSQVETEDQDEIQDSKGDSKLTYSGTFNLNKIATGSRKYPDGFQTSVSKIERNFIYVNELPENSINERDEVLVMNLQGINSGSYKFAHVINIYLKDNSKVIVLDQDIVAKGFAANPQDKVIIQRVPTYTSISTDNKITITADPFNGETGGVVAFRVINEIPDTVSVDVSGLGYRGGKNVDLTSSAGEGQLGFADSSYYNENESCGGGNAVQGSYAAGAGSHSTLGYFANSSELPAKAGNIIGSAEMNYLYLGCGGGSGIDNKSEVLGGSGGGVAIIFAKKLVLKANSIKANGKTFTNAQNLDVEVSSGGGSGGSILINTNELVVIGKDRISTSGGSGFSGSSEIQGQVGGKGRIRINANVLNGSKITDEQKNYLKQMVQGEAPFVGNFEE